MIIGGTCRAVRAPLLFTTLVALAVHVPSATAFERENVTCELEDLTRHVSLRVDPEAGYVCDVLYEKPDEGDTREVLWSARNNPDYCEPRFVELVEDLASRGWVCGPAEEADGAGDEPAVAAARGERAVTEGTARLRDWCVADATSGAGGEGPGSLDSYCECVAGNMASYDLSAEDAQAIIDGLPARSAEEEPQSPSERDKRLNTLAVNYRYAADSCR